MDRGRPDPLTGMRPQVASFALLMEHKLQENDGVKPHWKAQGLSVLWAHLQTELTELWNAFDGESREAIALEAADVACLAMMIADTCGGLDGRPTASLRPAAPVTDPALNRLGGIRPGRHHRNTKGVAMTTGKALACAILMAAIAAVAVSSCHWYQHADGPELKSHDDDDEGVRHPSDESGKNDVE